MNREAIDQTPPVIQILFIYDILPQVLNVYRSKMEFGNTYYKPANKTHCISFSVSSYKQL